jgi:anti-sigma factor RsiW
MNDCPNADVRDLLPDLLHGRLDEATRAMVESHVAGCAECRAELALLGDLRASTARTPALNLAAIAAAVPAYRAPVRRSWVGWRTAAAVTLVVVGASSIIVTQRIGTRSPDSLLVAAERPVAAPLVGPKDSVVLGSVADVPVPRDSFVPSTGNSSAVPVRTMPAPAVRELAMGGGSLTDLSDRELASLLKEIESLDAVPSTDVESVPIAPIAPRRGGP